MKKTISAVLAVLSLFLLTSCTKTISGPLKTTENPQTTEATTQTAQAPTPDASAFDIVLNAINKTAGLSSFSATTSSNISIAYLSTKESSSAKTLIRAENVNEANLIFSASSTYTEAGESIETSVYFENNNYYVDSYSIKVKIPANRGGDAYDYFAEIDKYLVPLSEHCYDSATLTDLNGGKSVTVEASAEDSASDFDEVIREMQESFKYNDLGDITFEGVSLRATTNAQGYIDVYTVSLRFNWKATIGAISTNSTVTLVWGVDFDEYGNVSVSAPKDYSAYKESSADEMPFVLLSERVEFMKSLDDIFAKCDMVVEMQLGTSRETFTITNVISAKNLSSFPVLLRTNTLSLSNLTQTSSIFYENGYYYYYDANENFKFSESVAKNEYKSTAPVFDIVHALPAEQMKNASVMVSGNMKIITVMLDEEFFAKEFAVIVDELNYTIAGTAVTDYKLYAPYVSVEIDANGYITRYDVIYGVDIPLGDDTSLYSSVTASVVFESLGEDVAVTPPSGYESFPEIGTDIIG